MDLGSKLEPGLNAEHPWLPRHAIMPERREGRHLEGEARPAIVEQVANEPGQARLPVTPFPPSAPRLSSPRTEHRIRPGKHD